MVQPHILLITFPAQGHINPSLQFAKRLIRLGIKVTFATSVSAQRRIAKAGGSVPGGLTFTTFSDGYDDGYNHEKDDSQRLMTEMRSRGSRTLRDVISASSAEGRPVTCLVYTLLLPWAAEVARESHTPSALLWIQPATVLDIYYHYFNGYGDEIKNKATDPTWSIELPNLPRFFGHELPSFMLPGGPFSSALQTFKEQLDTLEAEDSPKVLVNTFHSLESEALKSIPKYNMISIGPLIPSAFLDGKDPSDSQFGGDLFQKSKDYMEFLNSQPEKSVIYVSFGSLLTFKKAQKLEMARGLLNSGRPFLWVMRETEKHEEKRKEKEEEEDENENENEFESMKEELEQRGMIVPWCAQLEVLTHPSLGCFVTHCGWNSTLESLVCGVPVVAFPQWTDQGTNAKLIEDVWGTGVRVKANHGEDGTVGCDEIKRCIEIVMDGGERGEEMRENARKWRGLAMEAMQEDGSSNKNLKDFVEQVGVISAN